MGIPSSIPNETKSDDGLYIYMQYTGLKDKNGKEIMESDLVRCESLRIKKFIVVWRDGAFWLQVDGGNDGILLGNLTASELEVIGNIYENPELIKGQL